ncbi:hypothetical protein HYW30_02080, partial [Candidatus Azambacteria bacterium]|nr:hypothetical protein [Candidatus Azambacteria bacterium]
GGEIEVKGFRKGMAPPEAVERALGNKMLLSRVAEYAVKKTYPKALRDSGVEAIGAPNIEVTKLVRAGTPGEIGFAYRITVAVLPKIALPDYAKIARSIHHEPVKVEDREVEAALKWLQKSRAVPEVSNAFAQSLGNFQNLAALRESITTGLAAEKEEKERERWRLDVLDAIRQAARPLEIPRVLVENESRKMWEEYRASIAGAGLDIEEYLRSIGKSRETIIAEWEGEAEKRVAYGLILQAIAGKENIEVSKEEIEARANEHLRRLSSPEEAERAVDPGVLFAYTKGTLENEKVFHRLEEYAKQ